jgi:hypothetical protein
MAAHDSLSDQFNVSPQLAMSAETVRRDAARQHGVEHDAPNAPQVTGVRPTALPYDQHHGALATHHITVRYKEPDVTHTHVYGVDPDQEYMHQWMHGQEVHSLINPSTGKPTRYTTFRPG